MASFGFRRGSGKASDSPRGGAGASMEDAVVIDAPSSLAGVAAEYEHVAKQCGRENVDWTLERQALLHGPRGRAYDLLTVKLRNGSVREFYFDITSFFGKL